MVNLKSIFGCCAVFLLAVLILGGCGSGSGTTASNRTTKAKTSVKTSGLVPPGFLVGALEIVIAIPYGVTVELDPVTNEPSRNVVTLVGTSDPSMTMKALTYVAATPTAKGSLKIIYLNAAGFTPADSISVQLDIATGFFPTASDFSLSKFEVISMAVNADGSLTVNPSAPVQNPAFTVEVI